MPPNLRAVDGGRGSGGLRCKVDAPELIAKLDALARSNDYLNSEVAVQVGCSVRTVERYRAEHKIYKRKKADG